MAVTKDFTGRTHDLLIFQGVQAVGDTPIVTGWGDAGEIVTGIQKIVQTWAILFLTDTGTVLGDDERGTNFLQAVRQGRIHIEEDVPTFFALAEDRIQRTMDIDAVGQGLPDDERLDDASLLDFFIDRNAAKLFLRVGIVSIAGDSADIVLPISVSIR